MKSTRPTILEAFGLAVFAALGILAVEAVGLFEAADSTVLKLGLGGGAAYFFATSFWAALNR